MDVTVDLDGLRRVGLDPHLTDGPAYRRAAQLTGAQQQVGGTAQSVGDATARGDEQVEATVARIDRLGADRTAPG